MVVVAGSSNDSSSWQ